MNIVERFNLNGAKREADGRDWFSGEYLESDDEPTWRDVTVTPLRESPSYVYQGDQHSDEFVYLVGPQGELNPSDELCAAVEAVLARIKSLENPELDFEDVENDLYHALERYRGRA